MRLKIGDTCLLSVDKIGVTFIICGERELNSSFVKIFKNLIIMSLGWLTREGRVVLEGVAQPG